MHKLIDQVGGIEKAKAIVEGAPTQDCFYDNYEGLYYSKDHDHCWEWWDLDCKEWFECEFVVNQNEDGFIHLNDLRTAIEHHYYGRSEAEELAAYAELSHEKIEGGAMLVGDFSEARKIIDKQLESDHVTDITNHISPNTKVVEL